MVKKLGKQIEKYKKYSQLKKNVASGTVFAAGSALINIVAYPMYLKYLGAEKYGLWALISVVFTFSQVGQIGINTAITKYVASEYGRKSFKGITEYISTSIYILLVPALMITCLLALFKSEFADIIKLKDVFRDEGVQLIFLVGILSVFSFFVNAIKGVVVGIGRMDIAHYSTLMGRLLQIILNIILLASGFGIWSLYYGFVIFYVFPLILWIIILNVTYKIRIFDPFAFNSQKMKELIKFGGTLFAGMVAQMFLPSFIKVIIGRYIGLAEVAYYQIAFQFIMTLRNLFVRGLESILPRVSELYDGSVESFNAVISLHKKSMKVVFFFAFPLFLSVFICSEFILELWLQNEYNVQIAIVLRILLAGWLIHSLSVPDYFMFLGIGKVGYSVSATFMKTITNVLFISILLFLNISLTLNKVVLIESMGLLMEVIILKYRFFEFKKSGGVVQT